MSATPGQANPVRAFVAQLWGSVFRHGLPANDKVAARTALTNFFLHIHPVRVKKSAVRVSYTLCLGGLSFFLFILLTITGLFLMFYYIPSVDSAYQNVKDLQFVAVFGDIIRNMHRWAAHGMVITVWLHMARVFYQGAYKPPREFNWVIGTFLLLTTLLLERIKGVRARTHHHNHVGCTQGKADPVRRPERRALVQRPRLHALR